MTERLIELAFALQKAAPWEHLADNDIFAVRLRSGQVGYCSVMGNAGSHYALGLYVGPNGWNTYLNIATMAQVEDDRDEMIQIMRQLDCINCDFEHPSNMAAGASKEAVFAYAKKNFMSVSGGVRLPDFIRHSPLMFPTPDVNGRDAEDMEDALEVAVAVALALKKTYLSALGFSEKGIRASDRPGQTIPCFTPGKKCTSSFEMVELPGRTPVEFPKPTFDRIELAMAISQLPYGADLECRQVVVNAPVMKEDGSAFFPLMLLIVDGRTGYVRISKAGESSNDTISDEVTELAMNIIGAKARPHKIFVQDDRTEALLGEFCRKCGITLHRASHLKHLRDAWSSLNRWLEQGR